VALHNELSLLFQVTQDNCRKFVLTPYAASVGGLAAAIKAGQLD
jgi:hypothetical protein